MRKLAVLLLLLSFCACNDELVSNKYCSLPARLVFENTFTVPLLHTACTNMGEWCTIEVKGSNFYFTRYNGNNVTWPILEPDKYKGIYMGLSGFIVGLPNIPELGETVPVVTCYDLACRNCYDDAFVTRNLTLQEGGLAYCSRCQRTYDLNNTGQVSQGEPGNPLYRYRVSYGNNTLVINNR